VTESHNRYVAHLDILGMSSIVARDHDEAWSMLSALVDARDKSTNVSLEFKNFGRLIHVPEHVKAITFSDTILLLTLGDTEADLRAITIAVTQIFCSALYKRVPLRAGVAKGIFYVNFERSMFAGPALIDAYHIGESAQWLGVGLSASVAGDAKALALTSGNSPVVVDWPVPTKCGVESQTVINWPALMANQLNVAPPFSAAAFYEIFEPTFGPFMSLGSDVRVKYENTVEFFNAQYAAHVA
jgi:hypothetical protein